MMRWIERAIGLLALALVSDATLAQNGRQLPDFSFPVRPGSGMYFDAA